MNRSVLGLVSLLAVIFLSLACGGGSSTSPEQLAKVSYKGTVDESLLDDGTLLNTGDLSGNVVSQLFEVIAYSGDDQVGTSSNLIRTPAQAAGNIDFEYEITGLDRDTQYTFKVERDGVSILETVDTATTSTNVLSKPDTNYQNAPQINIYTTIVAQVVAGGNSLTSAMNAVFGTTEVDIKQIKVENGGSVDFGTANVSDNVIKAAKKVAVSVVTGAQAVLNAGNTSELQSVQTELEELYSTLQAIEEDNTLIVAEVQITIAVTSFSDNVQTVITSTNLVFDLGVLGESYENLDPTDANFSDDFDTQTEEAFTPVITSFEILDPSYGYKNGSDFTLYTLNPVFVVQFADVVQSPSSAEQSVSVTIVDGTDMIEIDPDSEVVDTVWNFSNNVLYLYVDSSAIRPGETYEYFLSATSSANIEALNPTSGNVFGLISVNEVTMTSGDVYLDIEDTPWEGVAVEDVSYTIDASSNIYVVDNTKADLGLVAGIDIQGMSQMYADGDFKVTSADNTDIAVTTATLSLSPDVQDVLTPGDYSVYPSLNLSLEDGGQAGDAVSYPMMLNISIID